ncbi:hypothetical protein AVEN_209523-1 [Araneus ventricosus]|uniref:Uncharacterized protein n=1 Tax=Araneus ventricosus TaxID=182803 RepID=A0A4Y2VIL2_ARAVE|nr:hypothetical protein AVEN_21540-1 [Araneus ventricosus]GBO25153.1 hypothetical protein AVEN_51249-1 [Araneus ventricosus]GBO25161.1 hypothetical protein AVEN_167136-1 [Araneus ventricosus]GBO25167.1 hypothetical protein AVEN_209523-1 [Araneus ventricosus]
MGRKRDYELFKCVQHGRENVEIYEFQNFDKCQSIQDVCSAVPENNQITIHELSEGCSISYGSVQTILIEDLGMRCVFDKFVPKLFSVDQTEPAFSCAQSP